MLPEKRKKLLKENMHRIAALQDDLTQFDEECLYQYPNGGYCCVVGAMFTDYEAPKPNAETNELSVRELASNNLLPTDMVSCVDDIIHLQVLHDAAVWKQNQGYIDAFKEALDEVLNE